MKNTSPWSALSLLAVFHCNHYNSPFMTTPITKHNLKEELEPIGREITAVKTDIAVMKWMMAVIMITVVMPFLKQLLS